MPSIPAPPVPKTAAPTPANIEALDRWLTAITAYHPLTSGKPWTFYEQMDAYLGPWGTDGYPIAYGKKYCELFYGNLPLNQDPAGARWVKRTLLLLQSALRTYIIQRFKAGTLGAITEDEFRSAAFDSHPKAYTEGGLTLVILLAPDLTRTIAAIPRTEFRPSSPSFGATVKQVVDTTKIFIPQIIGTVLATMAGPAHNQMWAVGSARDVSVFEQDRALFLKLGEVRLLVKQGRCDHLETLDRLRTALVGTTFADIATDQVASGLVDAIERRMAYVNLRYVRESARDRDLRDVFQEFDGEACTWRP